MPTVHGPQRVVTTYHTPGATHPTNPSVEVEITTFEPQNALVDKAGPDNVYIGPIYATGSTPHENTYHVGDNGAETVRPNGRGGLVMPNGSNCNRTDIAANTYVGMHRTSSIDYNIMINGSAYLITPSSNPKNPPVLDPSHPGYESQLAETEKFGPFEATLVTAGEVVVQRGTLHAWKAGPEGVRWVSVLIDAKPVIHEATGEALEEVHL